MLKTQLEDTGPGPQVKSALNQPRPPSPGLTYQPPDSRQPEGRPTMSSLHRERVPIVARDENYEQEQLGKSKAGNYYGTKRRENKIS